MRHILRSTIITAIIYISVWPIVTHGQYGPFQLGNNENILTSEQENAVSTTNVTDPLRAGAYQAINAWDQNVPEAVVVNVVGQGQEITSHSTALTNTLSIIKNIINYALGLISLVALIYLIYHGFLMVTAVGDDAQYKKGMKGLRYAAVALAWVGLSWFIISFIFRIIQNVTA